jgi:hypothetical protein
MLRQLRPRGIRRGRDRAIWRLCRKQHRDRHAGRHRKARGNPERPSSEQENLETRSWEHRHPRQAGTCRLCTASSDGIGGQSRRNGVPHLAPGRERVKRVRALLRLLRVRSSRPRGGRGRVRVVGCMAAFRWWTARRCTAHLRWAPAWSMCMHGTIPGRTLARWQPQGRISCAPSALQRDPCRSQHAAEGIGVNANHSQE